jgi:hypothetical protein
MSADQLCFFDPRSMYVPGASPSKPGRLFRDIQRMKQLFPDQFGPYSFDFLNSLDAEFGGTLIRLPLRPKCGAAGNPISSDFQSDNTIYEIFESFAQEAEHILLFLKSVCHVKISVCSSDGVVHQTRVGVNRSCVVRNVVDKVVVLVETTAKGQPSIDVSVMSQSYSQQKNDELSTTKSAEWRVRYDSAEKQVAVAAKVVGNQDGGISCPPFTEGRAFCFLPLPEKTGLPVHIHGSFELSDSRQDLRRGAESNKVLVQSLIASTYLDLLVHLSTDIGISFEQYVQLFPERKSARSDVWTQLVKAVYMHARKHNSPILALAMHPVDDADKRGCCACGLKLLRDSFSRKQWDAKAVRRCSDCIKRNASRKTSAATPTCVNNGIEVLGSNLQRKWIGAKDGVFYAYDSQPLHVILLKLGMLLVDSQCHHIQNELADASHPERVWTADAKFICDFVRTLEPHHLSTAGIDDISSILELHTCCFEGATMHVSSNVEVGTMVSVNRFQRIHHNAQVVSSEPTKLKLKLPCSEELVIDMDDAGKPPHEFAVYTVNVKMLADLPLLKLQSGSLTTVNGNGVEVFYSEALQDAQKLLPTLLFLHDELVKNSIWFNRLNPSSLEQMNIFRLNVQRLALNAHTVLPVAWENQNQVIWDHDSKAAGPSKSWMRMLWTFLRTETRGLGQKQTRKALQPMERWPLVPAMSPDGTASLYSIQEGSRKLLKPTITIEQDKLLKPPTLTPVTGATKEQELILKRLFDFMVLPGPCWLFMSLKQQTVVAVFKAMDEDLNPVKLNILTDVQRNHLRKFLMADEKVWGHVQALAVFETHHKGVHQFVALHNSAAALFCIVAKCPVRTELSRNWLKKPATFDFDTRNFYTSLKIPAADLDQLYTEHILPKLPELQEDERMQHLEFIRAQLTSAEPNHPFTNKLAMLNTMNKLAFVPVAGRYVKAEELCDPEAPLFLKLLPDFRFPPVVMRSKMWLKFLKQIGMTTKGDLKGTLWLECAQEIARREDIELAKAEAPVLIARLEELIIHHHHRFYSDDRKQRQFLQILTKISEVKFIPRFRSQLEFEESADQAALIAYRGSIFCEDVNLAFCCAPVMPEYVHTCDENAMTALGVLYPIPVDKVLTHLQSIGQHFCDRPVPQEQVSKWEDVCEQIYDRLHESKESLSGSFLSECSTCPLIMLPSSGTFAKPMSVYHELQEQQPPYYMKYPMRWGKYALLLQAFGVKAKPTLEDHIGILQSIEAECHGGGIMNPNDFNAFLRAMAHIMINMSVRHVQSVAGEITYAPDVDMHLRPCDQLIG